MSARTQSAFRSLSRWRISPEAEVAPGRGTRILTASPILSRNFQFINVGPPNLSGVVTEREDPGINGVAVEERQEQGG